MLAPAVRNSDMLSWSLVASPLTCLSSHPVEAVRCQICLEMLLAWGKDLQVFWEKLAGNLTFFFFFSGRWVNGEKLDCRFVVISTNSLIKHCPPEK